ncbi:DUF6503 family protein [uncultured Tenacibaculum sp.]|uniref:DUF6503 family protein n=1 Tax=uncultured Tenacibaculum sp. TaxID=174713 RepID=UPI002611DD52|nr:DUF6503 family protein [uncultured Tenacibaculum sp.]
MKYFSLLLLYVFVACKPEYTAQQIIDLSLEKSGVNKIKNATLSFTFRGKLYEGKRNSGNYVFTKIAKSDTLTVKDVLSNNGFKRYENNEPVVLSDKDENRFSNSVNSVHYFSVLPLGLNDKAVNKKLLEPVSIKGKGYYKIQVTFNKEGGGDDFDDVFLYWFNKETFHLEYLAYKYHTNEGGIRFRDIKKEHLVEGIRLLDYNNYKPLKKEIDFKTIDKLYEEDKLKKVSEIVLENIRIEL